MDPDITNRLYVYEKRSVINTTTERLLEFHNAPETMPKLAPPPIFVRIKQDSRTSLTSGELDFTLWFGPVPIHWVARHEPGPTPTSFADVMVMGPMAFWRHEHIFEDLPDGAALIDRLTIAHNPGLQGFITRVLFGGLSLRILFFYRHMRTKRALSE